MRGEYRLVPCSFQSRILVECSCSKHCSSPRWPSCGIPDLRHASHSPWSPTPMIFKTQHLSLARSKRVGLQLLDLNESTDLNIHHFITTDSPPHRRSTLQATTVDARSCDLPVCVSVPFFYPLTSWVSGWSVYLGSISSIKAIRRVEPFSTDADR